MQQSQHFRAENYDDVFKRPIRRWMLVMIISTTLWCSSWVALSHQLPTDQQVQHAREIVLVASRTSP
jgi:hypothetical protein